MNQLVKLPTADDIDKCTARLAVAFQRQIDAATVRVYREAMADLPLWAIEGAELQLRRRGGSFFPTAAAWHQTAEAMITARRAEDGSSREDECPECRNTSWAEVQRGDRLVCVRCSCWTTKQQLRAGGA